MSISNSLQEISPKAMRLRVVGCIGVFCLCVSELLGSNATLLLAPGDGLYVVGEKPTGSVISSFSIRSNDSRGFNFVYDDDGEVTNVAIPFGPEAEPMSSILSRRISA